MPRKQIALALLLEITVLFLSCGFLQSENDSRTITPEALTYPRQVKRGSSVILEVGFQNPGLNTFNLNVSKNGDTYNVTMNGQPCGDCDIVQYMNTQSVDLDVIDSRTIYHVTVNGVVGGIFDVKCTTDVYDSVSNSYEYDVITANPDFNADTLSMDVGPSNYDTNYTFSLYRIRNRVWESSFSCPKGDTLGLVFSSLQGGMEPFRLTKADRYSGSAF